MNSEINDGGEIVEQNLKKMEEVQLTLTDQQATLLRTMNRHQRKEWFITEMKRIGK